MNLEVEPGKRIFFSTIGDGPQVVVMPGGFYVEHEFEPLTDGRTIVLLHQRNRGRSDVFGEALSGIDREADDIEVLRRELGADRISLIGWSYAGLVTALYALDHPEHVYRLVHLCSLGPRGFDYPDEGRPAIGAARIDPEGAKRVQELQDEGVADEDPERFCRKWRAVFGVRQFCEPAAMDRQRSDPCVYPNEWPQANAERVGWLTPSIERFDETERLATLEAPMLVVIGLDDPIPLEPAREMARIVPDARLLELERCGHWPWLERPEVFFGQVDVFLAGD